MDVQDLLCALEQLRKLLAAAEANAAAKDLAALIACLEPSKGETIDWYTTRLNAVVARRHKKPVAPKAPNEVLVADWGRQLAQAGTNEVEFARVFAAVTADRAIKLKEADAIARQFTRQTGAFKTKKGAFNAIQHTFLERARFENKLRAVS